MKERLGLDAAQIKEVSAKPQKQKARTDWTFTFADTTIAPLPQGEPRIDVDLAGDEVASVGRYVHVPEEWERQQRAASTRNLIIQIAISVVFGGLLLAARDRRHDRVEPRHSTRRACSCCRDGDRAWRSRSSTSPTAGRRLHRGVSTVGAAADPADRRRRRSRFIGLALLAADRRARHRRAAATDWPGWDACRTGTRCRSVSPPGLFGAAVGALAALAADAARGRAFPAVDPLGSVVPDPGRGALDPITGFLTRLAVMTATLLTIDRITRVVDARAGSPGHARWPSIGFLSAGVPSSGHVAGWALAGALHGRRAGR